MDLVAAGVSLPTATRPDLAAERQWLLEAERLLTELGPASPNYAQRVERWQTRLRAYHTAVLKFGEPDDE